jgi:catechol-2,3-dioxygenase
MHSASSLGNIGVMPIKRLNHAVLYVRNVQRSMDFYVDVLGFRIVNQMGPHAVFLQAAGSTNDHDLGLFAVGDQATGSVAGHGSVGLYHLAWEVDTLSELSRIAARLQNSGNLIGASDHGTTKALYAKDPDGLEFEISWLVPADSLHMEAEGMKTAVLNLDAEIMKYGAETPGGVGVSH